MGIGVKLQRLRNEDFIWIVYFFIVLAALVSDKLEREFVLTNDYTKQKKFKLINIAILVVAFFIYLYFVLINYDDICYLRGNATKKEVLTSHAAFIAALLFLVGGIITLWAEIHRDTPQEDVGII